ncbi:hypothetical protein Q4I28_005726 [Leishmania naiffi]|uniref:Uncharacterized protein n=1 Tax=Leishmania naiffi TaxID=5678 RepID=A0AAW3BL36_9TRYP
MERFSHFLVPDSDSDSAEEATLRANQSGNAADGSLLGSAAHEGTNKDSLHSSQRNTESPAPAAEQPADPPSSHHSADGNAVERSAPDSQEREGGADGQSVVSVAENAVNINSTGTGATPAPVEAAPSDLPDHRGDVMPPPAASASVSPPTALSEKRIPTASPGARAAAMKEKEAQQNVETPSPPRAPTSSHGPAEPAPNHEASSDARNRPGAPGAPGTSSQMAAATTAVNAVAGATAASGAAPAAQVAPLSSTAAAPERAAANAEPRDSVESPPATNTHPSEEEAVASADKKKSIFSRFFSFCKKKLSTFCGLCSCCTQEEAVSTASRSSEAQSGRASAREAVANTEAQVTPEGTAAAEPNASPSEQALSIPVATRTASKHSSARSSKANAAELQGEQVAGEEAGLAQPMEETPAATPARNSASDTAPPPNETSNGPLGAADANADAAKDGGASAHSALSGSRASQGPDAAHEGSDESAVSLKGSEKAQKPTSKGHSVKSAKADARHHRQEPADGSNESAKSADLDEASGSGEDTQRSAHSVEAEMAKTSTTHRASHGRGKKKVSERTTSAPVGKGKRSSRHSHAAAAAGQSSGLHSPIHDDDESYSGSGSYSYGYSDSRTSNYATASSPTSSSIAAAQEPVGSDDSLRRSAVRGAYDTSCASKRDPKAISVFLQDEEPLPFMPAYRRRILLDLRARERRDAEEAAMEWRELTFRPQIHNNPFSNYNDASPAVMTDRSHSPFSGARGFSVYSPASGFSELSPGRYQVHRMSPRLLEPRCAPQQPAPPPFKPVISYYAKNNVKPGLSVFKRLYKPRSSSQPVPRDDYTHRPTISNMARQLYSPGRGDRLQHHPSEDDIATPRRRSVFDRLYRMRRSSGPSPTTSPSRDATGRLSFQPQITDMARHQFALLPKESFGDRLYRNDRSPRRDIHAPFHAQENFSGDCGSEHVRTDDSNSDHSSSFSQSSFEVRDTPTASTDIDRHSSESQVAVETV